MSKNRLWLMREHDHTVMVDDVEYEIHADGVKEVEEECPFCDEPCEQPHCPYTEKE